jgi:hypothetical protein
VSVEGVSVGACVEAVGQCSQRADPLRAPAFLSLLLISCCLLASDLGSQSDIRVPVGFLCKETSEAFSGGVRKEPTPRAAGRQPLPGCRTCPETLVQQL